MRVRTSSGVSVRIYALLGLLVVALTVGIFLAGRMGRSTETTFRGTLTIREGRGMLLACGASAPLAVSDETGALTPTYQELAGGQGEAVFVEVRGLRRGDRLIVTKLRRVELETHGCAEDLSGLMFRAFGNEPFWAMDVEPARIVLTRPGAVPMVATRPQRTVEDRAQTYTAEADGRRLELALSEQACRDSMSGAYFSYAASAVIDGQKYEGCAKEGTLR